jgi:FAD/FMN-containing dehydrogenase
MKHDESVDRGVRQATSTTPGLTETLRGRVIRPGDANDDEARTIYNAMIDKRPALTAQGESADDVVAAVRYGREHHPETAIRGGGHSAAGLALVDDGLVIELAAPG